MGDINNLTKVEIKEYVVQAQGIFTGIYSMHTEDYLCSICLLSNIKEFEN